MYTTRGQFLKLALPAALVALVGAGQRGTPLAALSAPDHGPLSPRDSVALLDRLKDAELRYVMDWRYSWQKEMLLVAVSRKAERRTPPPYFDGAYQLTEPTGTSCDFQATARYDIGRHEWMAHLIKAPNRIKLSLCPIWSPPDWYEPADERKSIDASLSPEGFTSLGADTARLIRKPVLRLLDSAAKLLPGDGWIAGQRVRLHLDQTEVGAARAAATSCKAQPWWCTALLGYVEFTAGELSRASATFDRARATMPDSLRCAWDDASMFFDYTGRAAYASMSCAQRDSVNDRVWWLADPLWVENGNERRTEHYARRVLIELHRAIEADERFDWRDDYEGPALTEMVLRYGWPTEIVTNEPRPMRWVSGNTRSIFLGDTTINFAVTGGPSAAEWCNGISPIDPGDPCGGRLLNGIHYWGPQFHTIPLWQTVVDPFHATDAGWDLAAARDNGPYWDTSWWPLEFYRRDNGALVPLATQIAFFRRQHTAILAVAMSWDTLAYLPKPSARMTGAVMLSTGPYAPFAGGRDTMSGQSPHPLVVAVPSGPALLGVEMVPSDGIGAAARTRFGVEPPPPLSGITRGELALSDIVLARATDGEEAPTSMVALMPRMLGTTVLRDPKRTALFWELYGLATGDTIGVAVRIIRKDDSNSLERLAGVLGLAHTSDDTVVVRWTEPRPGEPTATLEGGVTIRPRGVVMDLSALTAGSYVVEIAVQRPRETAPAAVTHRVLQIQRR